MTGPFRIGVFWRRAFAALVLGRKARVDCFRTVADLLESGFELERALDVTVRAQRGQGPSLRAGLLEGWRRALIENRFAEAMAASAPPAEAMIFQAYGRIEAALLFAAAARVADLRDRQISAVRKALAMPLTLAAGLAVMLWAAGGYFVPVLESVVPPERWGPAAGLFRAASVWLHAEPLVFCAICASIVAATGTAMVHWTGPGRTALDRIAPFSLYRTITGSAFLFVALEFLAAGLDLNDRAFEDLKRHASPYARHRIGAIQRGMARGAGLGRAMALAGHGFPDPTLVPVAAALDGAPGWEDKLARFVERWVGPLRRPAQVPRGCAERRPPDRRDAGHGCRHRRDVFGAATGRTVMSDDHGKNEPRRASRSIHGAISGPGGYSGRQGNAQAAKQRGIDERKRDDGNEEYGNEDYREWR